VRAAASHFGARVRGGTRVVQRRCIASPRLPQEMPMPRHAHAAQAAFPKDSPTFDTERFIVAPLQPAKARELIGVLLQDEHLARQIPWMPDKSTDGALREGFLLELQCAAGATKAWGIVERARAMLMGIVLARQSMSGIDLEVLCASRFWNQGIADEAGGPVAEWLEDNAEVALIVAQ
jgi:RimJ/RimL family protein N-acetyltransferase